MPKRTDLKSILVIGSGPIVIGQACEFDYSGTQACKALRKLGYRVILINSNPATIMTDPEVADATYIEPLTLAFAEQVVARERPDAILPTVGGQTGLNLALELFDSGVLERYGVELIGAKPEAIRVAEDRELFKAAMEEIGLQCAQAEVAHTVAEAEAIARRVGIPTVIRPSFTLGGAGGGIAYNLEELREIVANGLDLSPVRQVLVEESVVGWKEFELEVMRDLADNVIIICSIENVDPMGVHTGDSITVAPAMTLTDREYQNLRDISLKIIRRVGVETGGSNIQFAINPRDGAVRIIEMNPRVSRSSALASKATGFPIAKIAAQLAVGLTLDEIPNDITRVTPASFEPSIDYTIVKIPRWNFEKFPGTGRGLGTQMKSVGEVMGIGRSFEEALGKAIASLEGGYMDSTGLSDAVLWEKIAAPTPDRLPALLEGLVRGFPTAEIHAISAIDPWFLERMEDMVRAERRFEKGKMPEKADLYAAKRMGISDIRLAKLIGISDTELTKHREKIGLHPVYKRVDTCAAEFESHTPYLYSTYEQEDEAGESDRERVVILGNGPNRIGQGLEFDYCCCHAAFAVREAGLVSVMVNCNPETVSTDYDTSDKLYFEPVSAEHVRAVVHREQPRGTILQFGGQTPLKLSHRVGKVLGTSPNAIDICEDRRRFNSLLKELGIRQPEGEMVATREAGFAAAARLGFPLLVRPSYVLGGRAMTICWDEFDFKAGVDEAIRVSDQHPLLIDRFLEGAVEYDVDALCDGEQVHIAGIMEHIEEAGVHSGDSTTVYPAIRLSPENRAEMEAIVRRVALHVGVIGLVNVQFAVQQGVVFVIEVNPRASRTVPYLAKATGIPLAKLATRIVLGEKIKDLGSLKAWGEGYYFVKAPVFPWRRFVGSDVLLGPEMRSTGEVMGVGRDFGEAYAKALLAAGLVLPTHGAVFLSLKEADKHEAPAIAEPLHRLGFQIMATRGTAAVLQKAGIPVRKVWKVREGRPDVVDLLKNGEIQLLINSPLGRKAQYDEAAMRRAGLRFGVPCVTNLQAALCLPAAIESMARGERRVVRLQELGEAGG
ncbi:MAG TPA: carbamoyl-phosphate synthase large subunit [Myxococcota bacterium]|nr:carbamoyl-phosphate synthase large subunit [Myxococcota bacterium]